MLAMFLAILRPERLVVAHSTIVPFLNPLMIIISVLYLLIWSSPQCHPVKRQQVLPGNKNTTMRYWSHWDIGARHLIRLMTNFLFSLFDPQFVWLHSYTINDVKSSCLDLFHFQELSNSQFLSADLAVPMPSPRANPRQIPRGGDKE